MLSNRKRPSAAVLLVVLVVCSSAASVTALAGTAPAPDVASPSSDAPTATITDDDNATIADDVYVHENGDAVLVYEEDTSSEEDGEMDSDSISSMSGHLGMNVSEGLLHVLVRSELTESSNVTGDAQVVLTPSSLAGNGSFQAPRPENLEDLDVSVQAQRTETDMSGQADFDMTYVEDGEYSSTSMVESASTSGEMSLTTDAFSTSGSAQVELANDLGMDQHREYTLEEGTDQYRLQASEEYLVSSTTADQWETREDAKATLESQYASIASALGGSADVTIDAYSFTETESGESRLDIEYQIVYSNIDDALAQQVSQAVTSAEDTDVSTETAEALGDGIADLNVDRVHATLDADGTSVQSSWDVRFSNYDPLVRAGFDAAEESTDDENVTEQLEKARKNYEAMQAADYGQTFTWDASLSSPEENEIRLSGSLSFSTTNYEAYVSELEARDLPTQGSMSFSASAKTEGEQVVAEMEYSVEQEELVSSTVDSFMNSAEQAETGSENVQRVLDAFEQSDFEKAKMNMRVEEGMVTVQAGTSFENMASFQSVMSEEFGGDVTGMYADISTEDTTKSYVTVSGAFGSNATESDVREYAAVGEDTTIHMPDSWNASEKSFPSMDTQEARDYLGLEEPATNETSENDNSGGLPGFGVPAAFAAVAAVSALLLGRVRRRDA